MTLTRRQAYWLEVVGLGLVALALFRFGLLALAFLVPIQLVWIRRGESAGLTASAVFLAALAVMKLVDSARIAAVIDSGFAGALLLLDPLFALGFVVGLFVLNTERPFVPTAGGFRVADVVERMVAAVLAGALVYVPGFVALSASSEAGSALVAAQIELLGALLGESVREAELKALAELVVEIIVNGAFLGFFVTLIGNWWFGIVFAFRGRMALPEGNPVMARASGYELTRFSVPLWMVWVLIGGWGGVVLVLMTGTAWVAPVAWNVGLVSLAVYGVQGVAIVWYFLGRRRVSRGTRVAVVAGIAVGLLVPGLNVVVGVGLPGLGVSEIWIDYHRFDESEG